MRDTVLDCKGQESYQEYKIFKNRVLDTAVKEVNKKTDCHFAYEPIKRGRKVVKIKFIYHSKDSQVDGQLTFSDMEENDTEVDYGSELANLLGSAALNDEFSPEQVRVLQDLVLKAVKGDKLEKCNYLMHMVNKMNLKAPKNRFNYLCKMIENDIKGDKK